MKTNIYVRSHVLRKLERAVKALTDEVEGKIRPLRSIPRWMPDGTEVKTISQLAVMLKTTPAIAMQAAREAGFKVRYVRTPAGQRRFHLPIGAPIGTAEGQLPLGLPKPNPRMHNERDQERVQAIPSGAGYRVYRDMMQRDMDAIAKAEDESDWKTSEDLKKNFYDKYEIDYEDPWGGSTPEELVADGPWTKFGPCREIRAAAWEMLGFNTGQTEVVRGDTGQLAPAPSWGGAYDSIEEPERDAAILLLGLKEAERRSEPLYRGVTFPNTQAFLDSFAVGDTFDLPLASFSDKRSVTERFGTDVTFVLNKGARAIRGGIMGIPEHERQAMEDRGEYFDEDELYEGDEYREWISGGRFSIRRIVKNDNGYTVQIEQVGVFDLDNARLVKSQPPPKWEWDFLFDFPLAEQKDDEDESKTRHVRTAAGVRRYNLPLGSPIVPTVRPDGRAPRSRPQGIRGHHSGDSVPDARMARVRALRTFYGGPEADSHRLPPDSRAVARRLVYNSLVRNYAIRNSVQFDKEYGDLPDHSIEYVINAVDEVMPKNKKYQEAEILEGDYIALDGLRHWARRKLKLRKENRAVSDLLQPTGTFASAVDEEDAHVEALPHVKKARELAKDGKGDFKKAKDVKGKGHSLWEPLSGDNIPSELVAAALKTFEGQYGDFRTKVDLEDSIVQRDNTKGIYVRLQGDVFYQNRKVGSWVREVQPDLKHVYNSYLRLDGDVQGQKFADQFYRHAEEELAKQGIEDVSLSANIDVGGYAWARRGFDWDREGDSIVADLLHMSTRLKHVRYDIEDSVPESIIRQMQNWEQKLYDAASAFRVDETPIPWDQLPTMQDIASLGEGDVQLPPNRTHANKPIPMWPGKAILLGTSWHGRKPILAGFEQKEDAYDYMQRLQDFYEEADTEFEANDYVANSSTSDYNLHYADLFLPPKDGPK